MFIVIFIICYIVIWADKPTRIQSHSGSVDEYGAHSALQKAVIKRITTS